MAAVGLVGIIVYSNRQGGGGVFNPCTGAACSATLVYVTRDLNAGDTIQNADWQSISSNLPAATANLYFTPAQRTLFLGKTLLRSLHNGDLLAKDGDLLSSSTSSSIVPVTFKVAPQGLTSGDSLCIYAIDAGALRLFYLTPLIVTSSGNAWQATVPLGKAPFFLYAAVNMNLAAFDTTGSGVCPSTPIFSSTQAIEGATGATGTGG